MKLYFERLERHYLVYRDGEWIEKNNAARIFTTKEEAERFIRKDQQKHEDSEYEIVPEEFNVNDEADAYHKDLKIRAGLKEERKVLMPILKKAAGSGKVFVVTYTRSGRDYRGGFARYPERCYFIPTEAGGYGVTGLVCGETMKNNFRLPNPEDLTKADFDSEKTFYTVDRSLDNVEETSIIL